MVRGSSVISSGKNKPPVQYEGLRSGYFSRQASGLMSSMEGMKRAQNTRTHHNQVCVLHVQSFFLVPMTRPDDRV
jgi:hypothetical protein